MGNSGMWCRQGDWQGDSWWVMMVCGADRVTDRVTVGG